MEYKIVVIEEIYKYDKEVIFIDTLYLYDIDVNSFDYAINKVKQMSFKGITYYDNFIKIRRYSIQKAFKIIGIQLIIKKL